MSAPLFLLPGLPGLPGVVGALMAVGGRGTQRFAPTVAVMVATATLVLAVLTAVTRPTTSVPLFAGLRSGARVDGLSAVMVVTVSAVALAVLVFATGEMRAEESCGRFFGLMLLFTGAMLVTVTAADLAILLMAWEVMGAMSYALIGFWWRAPDRVRSADIAFVTTRAGDLGLYLSTGAALAATGSVGLAGLGESARPWRDIIAAGIVLAALGKSAQLPFSFWLSRAMAGPSAVSALLHSATMVAAGAYLLLRTQPLLTATGWAATLVAWAGALTALALGAVAVAQRDLKQLLAASTCAQIAFMVLGAGVAAVAGGTAQLVAHAAVKSLLFLGAGAWLAALGTKDMGELHGAAREYPLVGITFAVGGLALAGLPPLSLWVSKDAVLTVAADQSTPLYLVSLAAALLAAAYAMKAVIAVWLPADAETRRDTERRGTRRVGLPERVPLPALALVAVLFGVAGIPAVFDGWRRLVGAPAEPGPAFAELLLSGALAVAVALVALAARRARVAAPGFLREWLFLERGVIAVVWRPLVALARALARFDDRVIDGFVGGVSRTGMGLAALMRRTFEKGVDDVVRGVATGAARLGALARRPQTGQVHTYFAQAAVALLVLAVVVALVV
ncbi:NADH-quinone oxidoreductase subunit L [Microtetraspora sp. AC03309]|uniref:NADH-quinone oxidoreductase subunit 5 family protein n=1 Tax=Microtetraspora sp. AC03309 TaxID=2779376 RepID=UPI001E59350A|nr:proton-conducting transporter membrane subunit [Microtetraspora sp. AC03309]MCC5577728.1 NADH-quinone oxidoreductase subunit L [Microtetraspora sp. AC03309]